MFRAVLLQLCCILLISVSPVAAQNSQFTEVIEQKPAAVVKQKPNKLLDCSAPPAPLERVDPNASFGFIHDIIGQDGALVITMLSVPERFEYASKKLKQAGIIASQFPAADGYCEPEEDIVRGCPLRSWENNGKNFINIGNENHCFAKQGWGGGCDGIGTAACAESHHRALELAQYRESNWTLIMEDDVVPLEPQTWQENFKQAWPKVPASAKIVRLGWCSFPVKTDDPPIPVNPIHLSEIYDGSGRFSIIRNITNQQDNSKYDAGFCTTAYMIHRDAIPDMLGLFPCCCGSDCCFAAGLFNNDHGYSGKGETWGFKNMVSIGMKGSAEMARGWNRHQLMYQFGPLVQDNREVANVREI